MTFAPLIFYLTSTMYDWLNSEQEQELYKKEGLGVTKVQYTDNQDCIGESLPTTLSLQGESLLPLHHCKGRGSIITVLYSLYNLITLCWYNNTLGIILC